MPPTNIRLGIIVHWRKHRRIGLWRHRFRRSTARTSGFHQPLRSRRLPRSRGPAGNCSARRRGRLRVNKEEIR